MTRAAERAGGPVARRRDRERFLASATTSATSQPELRQPQRVVDARRRRRRSRRRARRCATSRAIVDRGRRRARSPSARARRATAACPQASGVVPIRSDRGGPAATRATSARAASRRSRIGSACSSSRAPASVGATGRRVSSAAPRSASSTADVLGDRGLRVAELARGARERAEADDGHEGPEEARVHQRSLIRLPQKIIGRDRRWRREHAGHGNRETRPRRGPLAERPRPRPHPAADRRAAPARRPRARPVLDPEHRGRGPDGLRRHLGRPGQPVQRSGEGRSPPSGPRASSRSRSSAPAAASSTRSSSSLATWPASTNARATREYGRSSRRART